MNTKRPNNSDDDNFFDDDLFDSDLFDDDDDDIPVRNAKNSKQTRSDEIDPEEESLFDELLSGQVDVKPASSHRRTVNLDEFEEDHTEVIIDDDNLALPNTYLTDEKGKVFNIRRTPFLIGRSKECDLVINVKGVSRRHAELTFGAGHFVLRDLDSLNGTKVNGTPVPQIRLNDADMIQLGRQKFSFFTDTHSKNRPTKPRAVPARPAKASVNEQEPVVQESFRKNNDWLVKINFVVVAFIILVALTYIIIEDLESNQEEKVVQQDQIQLPPLPGLGQGDLLQVGDNDWTKTGALPQLNPSASGDDEVEALARAVEAQMNGEDPPPLERRKPREDIQRVGEEVKEITAAREREAQRKAEAEARESQEELERQNIQLTGEARALLDTMVRAYESGDQLTPKIKRMLELSKSTVLNTRLKRELANTHKVYSGLSVQYQQGQDRFEKGATDTAFQIWQELLAQEKEILGDVSSYYSRQISERAIDMTIEKAAAAEAAGNIGEAIKLYKKLAQLKPDSNYKGLIDQLYADTETKFDEAEKMMSENPAEAVKLFQDVMDATPRDHPMYIRAEAKLVWLKEGL